MDCKIKDKSGGGFRFWEEWYQRDDLRDMPWYWGKLDGNVTDALKAYDIKEGKVLDLGTGPGTQACRLTELGFDVTATDISPTAICKAETSAKQQKLTVNFLVDDILESSLTGSYDLIVDRGCFHVLPPEKRELYVQIVVKLMKEGGCFLLKTFSEKEPHKDGGPYKFSPQMIGDYFEEHMTVIDIRETVYEGPVKPLPIALFAVMKAES